MPRVATQSTSGRFSAILAGLVGVEKELAAELEQVRRSISAFGGFASPAVRSASPEAKVLRPKKAKRARKAIAKPKRAKKAAPPARRKAPRLGPDEPRTLKGRMPSKGVESYPCADEADRRRKVEELSERGLERCKPLERLSAGHYDVVQRDGGAVVLWIPAAED